MAPTKAAKDHWEREYQHLNPYDLDDFAQPLVDMLEKHQWADKDCCPECAGLREIDPSLKEWPGHETECAFAKLLEHHGRSVKWKS